jgi:hypothetical protein
VADPASTAVYVAFSAEPERTRTELAFSLSTENAQVPGRISWSDAQTLAFTPWQALETEREYVLKVGTQAEDLDGNSLREEFILRFHTRAGTARPALLSHEPADGARTATRYPVIVARFSQAMDPASLMASLTLSPSATGIFSWNAALTEFTFTPTSPLAWQEEYEATIASKTLSANGFPLGAEANWRFTPGLDEIPPQVLTVDNGLSGAQVLAIARDSPEAPGATATPGWEKDWDLRILFSEPMEEDSVEGSLSILPASAWETAWNETSTELRLDFAENLAYPVVYALSINTAAEDREGNPVEESGVWRFKVSGPRSAPPRLERVLMRFPAKAEPFREQTIFDRSSATPYTYFVPFLFATGSAPPYADVAMELDFVFLVADGAEMDFLSFAQGYQGAVPSGGDVTIVADRITVNSSLTNSTVTVIGRCTEQTATPVAVPVRFGLSSGILDSYGNALEEEWSFTVMDRD